MTNAAYARKWPRFENFPTTARGCATRAASMIKAGFVIHDPFDSCFKMGHGYDVMALLVNDAMSAVAAPLDPWPHKDAKT